MTPATTPQDKERTVALVPRAAITKARPGRETLQKRLLLFLLVLCSLLAGLYGGGILLTLAVAPKYFLEIHLHPAKIFNLGLLALMAFGLLVLKRRVFQEGALIAIDALITMVFVSSGSLAVATLPRAYSLQELPLMFLIFTLMLRSALVPSPTRRTVWIGMLPVVPVLTAVYVISQGVELPPQFLPVHVTLGAFGWCVASISITAVTSRIIYGLHEQVEDARKLGQYTLLEKVGEGGMGSVFRARHAMLRRPTAIKLLLPDRAGPENLARFEREVQQTSRLTHPNTVAIYDYGRTPDGLLYYAMEYIDGLSLEDLVESYGPLPASRAMFILRQAAEAIAEAHDMGLIHRDIKPGNVLLCERGGLSDVVKVVDFGLVKDLRVTDEITLTQDNILTGTPLYLAPESIVGNSPLDARVDLYALGGVAYFLLTGAPVFNGRSVLEVCSAHLQTPPVPPSLRSRFPVPPELDEIVLRCLEKSPSKRPSSARELAEALAACSATLPGWSQVDARQWWDSHRRGAGQKRAPQSDAPTASFAARA